MFTRSVEEIVRGMEKVFIAPINFKEDLAIELLGLGTGHVSSLLLFIPIDCKVVSTSHRCPVGWKWMTLCFLGSL